MNSSSTKFRFSIITCTYNSEKYLEECIKSVESQNFKDFEHIFVDAFSTDQTIAIIKNYQLRNPNQVKIIQQEPKGISNAMNVGINNAGGEIILHLHSDDYLYNNQVLTMVDKKFKESHAMVLVGNCLYKRDDNFYSIWPKNKVLFYLFHKFLPSYLFLRNGIPHPSTFVKKEVFTRRGLFLEDLKTVMDYEFWFRIFKKEKFVYLKDYLSVYRVHQNTVSNKNIELADKEVRGVIKSYKKDYFFELIFARVVIKPALLLFSYLKKKK
jgi:glycosyltransferase involved in cell wall biosynthesis